MVQRIIFCKGTIEDSICENIKEKNKEIDDIYKLIGYKSSQDRIKYYDKKLYIPTIFFRAYYSKPKDYQIDWNKYSIKEKKFFEIWESLVDFCEGMDIKMNYLDTIGAGEGSVMSISAYNSGIKVHSVSNLVGFITKHFISNYVEKVNNIKPWNIAG